VDQHRLDNGSRDSRPVDPSVRWTTAVGTFRSLRQRRHTSIDMRSFHQGLGCAPGENIMKLVLFGATGNVGQRVAAEALRRGHEVIGVVRDPAAVEPPDPRVPLVKGDATNAESVADVARGAEAVVSAISPRPNARGLPAPSHSAKARALITGLRK